MTEDEILATGLLSAAEKRFGKDLIDKVIEELPARQHNDAKRVQALLKQKRRQ